MLRTTYWQNCTSPDLRCLDPEQTLALLPVSAVEQHGPHLPLATDAIIADGLVREAMQRVPEHLLVLPPMSIGHSLERTSFSGTLSVAAEPLLASWLEIGRSVARTGLRKLIILNTHGGNVPLVQLAALRLRQELGMLVVRANYFSFAGPPGLFSDEELRHGIHGGEMETSLLLHLRPDLVRQEALADFRALTHGMASSNQLLGPEKAIGFGWMSEDLHQQGVCGNAARADAKRGEILLSHLADQLATLIGECQSTPLSILRLQPNVGD